MIWTSRFLFLHPHTTLGVNLSDFILSRSIEPVFLTGNKPTDNKPRKKDKRLVQVAAKPHECLLEAEVFFNRRQQSIVDFERIFVGMRNPYDLEVSRYLHLLAHSGSDSDPARNIARNGTFKDFLEYAPLNDQFPPRLDRYFEVLREAPENLRILRFESFREDFCEQLSPYLSDVEAIDELIPPPNRFEQVYDVELEALCYRRNLWFFDSGHYPRLALAHERPAVRVGPVSVLALLSEGRQAPLEEVEVAPAPVVSIVIRFHNDAGTLRDALISVYRQSFVDWELLLVDDGSTDGSLGIVAELAAVDSRVRCLRHDDNQSLGRIASHLLAYRHARGEFIAKLEADSFYVSDDAVAEQVALMRAHPQAAMVYGPGRVLSSADGATATQNLPISDQLLTPPKLAASLIRHWGDDAYSRMERLDAVNAVGGYELSLPAFALEFGLLLKLAVRNSVYVSSHCWYQRRMNPAPDFGADDESVPDAQAQLAIYEWAEAYLRSQRAHNRHTRRALRARIWPSRHPRLARLRYVLLPKTLSRTASWLDRFSPRHHIHWRYVAKQTLRWLRCRVRVNLLRAARLLRGQARGDIVATPRVIRLERVLPGKPPAGAVQLHWQTSGTNRIAVRVGAPNGDFVIGSDDQNGMTTTGKWVEDRAWFFLQDADANDPRSWAATLDVVQVRVREPSGDPV